MGYQGDKGDDVPALRGNSTVWRGKDAVSSQGRGGWWVGRRED